MKYLCYDTALNETYTLVKLMQHYPRYISLFAGTDDENIWDAAPYLFEAADNFYELSRDRFISLQHCIVFETREPVDEICRFLQYYIYQWPHITGGYFRIWDARVLLRNLPHWTDKERQQFFEGIDCFFVESEDPLYFDKWTLRGFFRPVSERILKTEVLESFRAGEESRPSSGGEHTEAATAVKNTTGLEKNNVRGEEQLPKRRRFFMD
ncbi:DUF4123 domain-containing protein [Niabella aquatica]